MSIESRVFVRIPPSLSASVLDLATRASDALARAQKLPPGDRTEAVRFEMLHTAIDQMAIAAMANGEAFEVSSEPTGEDIIGPSVFLPKAAEPEGVSNTVLHWLREDSVVVELRLPHFAGSARVTGEPGIGPPRPATRWKSSKKWRRDAEKERFEALLTLAVEGSSDPRAAVHPSGISNRVLTEGLRKFTQRMQGQKAIEAKVQYRDGSKGKPFPLRSLSMTNRIPDDWRTLRFALLSIRHVELDAIVDGAWLRNVNISRSREAGFTDEIVFNTSLRQLRRLAYDAPTLIYIYQTGLDSAIVGFYRAVIRHLLDNPGSICVVPMYFQENGPYLEGAAWTTI